MSAFTEPLRVLGQSAQREAAGRGLKAVVREFLGQALGDPPYHAELVAGGPFKFRQQVNRNLGGFYGKSRAACDDLADSLFRFLSHHWREQHPGVSATAWLDQYAPKAPPTSEELEDSFELEIASDERVMRKFYEGSCRTRKGRDMGERKVPLKEGE